MRTQGSQESNIAKVVTLSCQTFPHSQLYQQCPAQCLVHRGVTNSWPIGDWASWAHQVTSNLAEWGCVQTQGLLKFSVLSTVITPPPTGKSNANTKLFIRSHQLQKTRCSSSSSKTSHVFNSLFKVWGSPFIARQEGWANDYVKTLVHVLLAFVEDIWWHQEEPLAVTWHLVISAEVNKIILATQKKRH
jgi:hypothetical protein